MAKLVLGPLLRYVGETEAVLWVETDEACEVEILGHREPTFNVAGHHFALVIVEGLTPVRRTEYEVALDGERRWPEAGSELPAERDRHARWRRPVAPRLRLLPGLAAPSRPVHAAEGRALRRARVRRPLHARGRDAGRRSGPLATGFAVARRPGLRRRGLARDPRLHPQAPRHPQAAGGGSRRLRGVHAALSRVLGGPAHPLAAVDRVDLDGDRRPRHPRRLEHLRRVGRGHARSSTGGPSASAPGSPPTGSTSSSATCRRSCSARATCWPGCARPTTAGTSCASSPPTSAASGTARAGATAATSAATRLIVIDSRIGRVLDEDRRSMLNERGVALARAAPLRRLRPPADRHLGPARAGARAAPRRALGRGGRPRRLGQGRGAPGEKLRRAADFDHWAAFGESFERLTGLLARAGAGEFGTPPATITVLSGDVHHAYLAELAFPASAGVRSSVWQAVCSPFRNALDSRERKTIDLGDSRVPAVAFRAPRPARRRRPRACPLAPGRGPLLRQPGRDDVDRRP